MPSWNIHTAHVERLLREGGGAEALGVRSANEFLFGNFVPDIYVGYMVHRPTRTIDYKVTHFASGDKIPLPDYDKFWRDYIEGRGRVSDVVIGAWCHLVCDHVYNSQTRRYIASIGVVASDETRIRKQHDFDLFGRTLDISMRPEATSDLVRASVQQLRVPYRVGYTALAAFRFVPRFGHELDVIRQAHRVRGSHGGRGPLAALARWWGYIVPLLAGAIRHAERVALAMDARAFGAYPDRTERHLVPWRPRDTTFVVAFWIVSAVLLVIFFPWTL